MAEPSVDSGGAFKSALPAGSTVGKYRIIRRLGEGGMATIYLASSVGPGGFTKQCALKVVRPEFVGRESISRMLATEARVAAALNHPHIVQVFDFGRLGGSYFMAMEWVDGVSLGHVMARMMRERRRVPIAVVAHVITSVAEALAYLGEGVDVDGQVTPLVHRDVSPSNVLLSLAGTVKLSDFGVVKILDESSETKTGVVKGKYAYMSPEQLRGEPVDHRADLFSLGVVLFEMLTMARLFQRKTTAGTIAAVHAARVPPPSSLWADIPPELDALVLRMLARKREDRFSSAAEVVSALQPFLTHGARGELATEVRALSSAESTRPSLGPASRSPVDDPLPAVSPDEFEALEVLEGEISAFDEPDAAGAPRTTSARPEPWALDESEGGPVNKTVTPTGANELGSAPKIAAAAEPTPSLRRVVLAAVALVVLSASAVVLYATQRAPTATEAPAASSDTARVRALEAELEQAREAARAQATPTPGPSVAAEAPVAEPSPEPSAPPAEDTPAEVNVAREAAPSPRAASNPRPAPRARAAAPAPKPAAKAVAAKPATTRPGAADGLATADDVERSASRKTTGTSVDGVILADEDDVDRTRTPQAASTRKPKAASVGDAVIAEDYD